MNHVWLVPWLRAAHFQSLDHGFAWWPRVFLSFSSQIWHWIVIPSEDPSRCYQQTNLWRPSSSICVHPWWFPSLEPHGTGVDICPRCDPYNLRLMNNCVEVLGMCNFILAHIPCSVTTSHLLSSFNYCFQKLLDAASFDNKNKQLRASWEDSSR